MLAKYAHKPPKGRETGVNEYKQAPQHWTGTTATSAPLLDAYMMPNLTHVVTSYLEPVVDVEVIRAPRLGGFQKVLYDTGHSIQRGHIIHSVRDERGDPIGAMWVMNEEFNAESNEDGVSSFSVTGTRGSDPYVVHEAKMVGFCIFNSAPAYLSVTLIKLDPDYKGTVEFNQDTEEYLRRYFNQS